MKNFAIRLVVGVLFVALFVGANREAQGQSVFDANDPIVVYNPANPPLEPTWGQVGKWVKTNRVSWNTSQFKSYIYKGMAFRLKYPKNYTPGDGKKYPLFIFFHGMGEPGPIYDNEYQLYHGAGLHRDAVNSEKYDGFLLYPQNTEGPFTRTHRTKIAELIERFLVPEAQVDPFRVTVSGLSGGGGTSWYFMREYPLLTAAIVPMSSVVASDVNTHLFLPIWLFQGALDLSPAPGAARALARRSASNGGNFTYTEYPNRAHDTWSYAWKEPNYFPFISQAHKANPWVLHRRTTFCPGENINVTIGVTAGHDEYQWRKDGVVISGATSNTIGVTSIGTYECRIRYKDQWSPWSPIPVKITYQGDGEVPAIQMKEFASKVLPSPDGKTSVELEVPQGFAGYSWVNTSGAQVGTDYNYAAKPGTYRARIKISETCETPLSAPFTIIDANGPNKPDSVVNLIVNKVSQSSLRLDWLSNPAAANPATEFEIYVSSRPGGPYKLSGITQETSYQQDGLTPGEKYYFVVRAVNNTAAAPLSREVSSVTDKDNNPPSSPANLTVNGTTQSSVSVSWTAATDDVGVMGYDVYVNGVKSYFTDQTSFTVHNLNPKQFYTISVKAKDLSGNESSFSNQVSAQTISQGLIYKFYTHAGDITHLPDFNQMEPQAIGLTPNVSIDNRTQETNYAYMWEGEITIPQSGNYSFQTRSDEGSKLYIGTSYNVNATALVDNDGVHTTTSKTGTIYLEAGVYPITITYFQLSGAQTMSVYWSTPQGGGFVPIPNSAFAGTPGSGGSVPEKPDNLRIESPVLYNKVQLRWNDNSSNENAFEVFRSDNGISFHTIAVLPSNATSYIDTTVKGATKYYYKVRAINQHGESPFDKLGRGVDYTYYETGITTQLPDFNTMIPVKTGRINNFSLGMQERSNYFALKYSGVITLPVTGNYTFYISSSDGSRLYIGGEATADMVVNHDGLHDGTGEVSASKHFAAGTYPIHLRYFKATGDDVLIVSYKGPDGAGIDKQIIPFSVLGEEPVSVTTPVAPAPPAAPAGLEAYDQTSSSIKLRWTTAPGASVDKIQVFRSYKNNTDYFPYAELPGNATSFNDAELFSNTLFFYKIKAIGPGGESTFSNEVSATTKGLLAVIDVIENQFMKFGSVLQVPVGASNGAPDLIELIVENLPAFGSFNSSGNNKGVITFNNPGSSQQGVYNNIVVKAVNPQGDTTVALFNLTVNDNNPPVITGFSDVQMIEWETRELVIKASDEDGETLSWTFAQMPAFVTTEIDNNEVKIILAPRYKQAGTYKMIVTVRDTRQGRTIDTLSIVVNEGDIPGRRVFINFSDGTVAGPSAKWNNTNTATLPANTTFESLKDENGETTTVSLKLLSTGFGTGNDGVNTGNNTGIYPDNVLRSHYWVDGSRNIEISGLSAGKKYNFTFLGSYNNNDRVYSAKYTINGESVSLDAAKNASQTVSITGVRIPADGKLTLNVGRADDNNATRAYLTAMVVEEIYDDSSAPARPVDLSVRLENDTVKLNWMHIAYNADKYEVYRGVRLSGPFVLLNPGMDNNKLDRFDDVTTLSNKTYYYVVRVRNEYGVTNSKIVWMDVPNKAPRIDNLQDVYIKTGEPKTIPVKAVDDPMETISLTVTGLPSFASFKDNGDGHGVITLTPSQELGLYEGITVTATDSYGASSVKTFNINIIDRLFTSAFVNFNPAGNAAELPWNNFNAGTTVAAGATLNNLKDETNAVTTYAVRINEVMSSHSETFSSGNNGGAYPDAVITTGFKSNAATSTLTVSGLQNGKKYNLVFYSSAPAQNAPRQVFASGNVKDTLDVAVNYDKIARLSGLTPVNNQITVAISKLSGSGDIYLGAMVIEAHSEALTPPSDLRVNKNEKTSLELAWDINETAAGTTLELWRSASPSTGYVKVADLPGSSKSYTDNGLTPATVYYYKMRSVRNGTTSDYSSYISAATIYYAIHINFNDGSPGSMAAGAWNNTNELLTEGFVLPNMINADYKRTGVNMSVLQNFNGYDDFNGTSTGDNSGVVPDNVMRSFYYIQYTEVVRLKVTGLSQNMRYNFVFFSGSKDANGKYVNYVIGNETVFLDWRNNTSRTVQINAKPDAAGSVEIMILTSTPGSKGYLNGLSIQALPDTPDGSLGSSGRDIVSDEEAVQATPAEVNRESQIHIGAYPTPFVNDITVDMHLKVRKERLAILLRDGNGKVVAVQTLDNVPAGRTRHKMNINGSALHPGAYYLQVLSTTDGESSVIKLMK